MEEVLLYDGLNAIHRGNIKFGSQDPDKQSFHVVYNFFRSLRATVSSFNPTKVFFCLEGKNNFRYSLFSDYKANRIIKKASKDNTDIDKQRDIVIKLLEYLPITLAHAERFEADDVIGTLCENLKEENNTIISSDSDFIQLLQRGLRVKLYHPGSKEFLEPPKYHYLVWKILRGDKKTDNIPGLMSDAKALAMVSDPQLLEDFLSIEENKAAFNLNKQLIELSQIPDEEMILSQGTANFEALKEEFEKMEFKSFLVDKYWSSFKETFSSL
jgi:5'-3' exonuclease